MTTLGALRSATEDRARLIDRDDLVSRLDRSAERRVTVVSAPAGSGKTSLLRAWAAGPGGAHRVAFASADQREREPEAFWFALLSAVRQACGSPGEEASPRTPGSNGRAMADRVLTELAGQGGRVTLVIDDAHELNAPEALAELARLLTNLPGHAHAIVATRRDLPLRLHQLRLEGELAEIRAADLRFSQREAGDLLAAAGIELSEGGTALLWQRTEGWAAGLRLAALSLAGHPDPERFAAEFSGSDRTVAEYLLGEMLDRQPADVRDLLLRTCLLDRVNGELADLLTGRPGSEWMLLRLEDANAFVLSLDAERTWFRYHRLFRDLLQLQLRRTLPDEVAALHRRAARWLSEHGQVAEAIMHTQAAGDWPGAARLLADHCLSLMLDGQAQTIRSLVLAFPPGDRNDPELALVRATGALARGRCDEAAAYLAMARSHAETADTERRPRLRLAITSAQLWLARRRGDMDGVIAQAESLACAMTGQSDSEIALGSALRAAALMNLGIVEAWSPRPSEAARHLEEALVLARQVGRPYLEVGCLAWLGSLTGPGSSGPGSSGPAVRRCRDALALAERHGWGADPMVAVALVALAEWMVRRGDFHEGERWLERAQCALQADFGADIRMRLQLAAGMLYTARGRHREALAEFTAAEDSGSQLVSSFAPARVTGWLLAAQVRLGMVDKARAALAGLAAERTEPAELGNARAMVGLAEGDPAAALAAVRRALDAATAGSDITIVESHLLAALAHRELDDQRAANAAAERALALAEPDRLVLPFLTAGASELLEALPRHETAHGALLADILDLMRGAPSRQASPLVPQPAKELSHSELRVLRYLPTNLSRPEIAAELSVSVNTVSTHIRRIYAKLGIDDRSAAVRCARELRLLAAPSSLFITGIRRRRVTSSLGRLLVCSPSFTEVVMMRRKATAAVTLLAASLAGATAIPAVAEATSAGVTVSVVQSGLNTPRHVVLTRSGLVVTESGAVSPVGALNCATGPATEGAGTSQFCTSSTGAIVKISPRGQAAPILTGLPSVTEEAIQEVTGPSAIAYGHGQEAVTIDDFLVNKDGGNGLLPQPFASAFGTLRLISHRKTTAVDLAAFAAAYPQSAYSLGTVPGETAYDSDPYDVIAYRGGWVVADAGANDLLYVSANGRVSILARFPAVAEQVPAGVFGNPAPITVDAQAVPTSVAVGPDGALYVGLLRGAPSDPGTADIYRVVPGQRPEIWAHGLTSVTAIAFDRRGRLLATEFNTGGLLSPPTVSGALVRISKNGQTVTTLPVPGLFQPTGVAVNADGTVYVSNYGDSTAAASQPGEILKVTGLS